MSSPRPDWWVRLAERAARPPERVRRVLHIEGVASPIGSIEVELAERMRGAGLPLRSCDDGSALLIGPADATLGGIAAWLHAQGVASKWRNELLAVTDDSGTRHAVIERAAVRPLGIMTYAVHLIGFTPNGSVWVQQRAFDKATDPGQWDTLVGGLVAADESGDTALERETWEEAGLRVADLRAMQRVDRITIRRPVREGYMVEHIDAFEAMLPDAIEPVNQDGEVERFECLAPPDLIERLVEGRFTLEAALTLARSLRRRGLL
jgi:8-oxo-dGTP pyrophosphatase MutT (NUDIX family)